MRSLHPGYDLREMQTAGACRADRDFPKLPNHREVKFGKVDAATLRDMIAKTFFSISNDETRSHLNGVLFECEGSGDKATARMVSTDGHRLSKCERAMPGAPQLMPGIVIPRRGLMELRRALESGGGKRQGEAFARRFGWKNDPSRVRLCARRLRRGAG